MLPKGGSNVLRLGLPAVALIAFIDAWQPAHAALSDVACQQAQAAAQKDGTSWVGLDRAGKPTAIKAAATYDKKLLDKIVYLPSRGDGSTDRTVLAFKLKYSTQGNYLDRDWVRLQNNVKSASFSQALKGYQDYHAGSAEIFNLQTNFHLTRGVFSRQIPFTTYDPAERRRQFSFPQPGANEEASYRAYLLTLDGIQSQATCVDFKPFFPNGTKQTEIEAVDLRPEQDSGLYNRSTVKFGVGE
jgi:hypothetical protein